MTPTDRRGAALDVLAVLVFVVIGRLQHDGAEAFALAGFVETLWPFAAGVAIGIALVTSTPVAYRAVVTGAGVVAATVVFGLALRYASGQGIASSFAIVTIVVLAALMLGWRFAVRVLARR